MVNIEDHCSFLMTSAKISSSPFLAFPKCCLTVPPSTPKGGTCRVSRFGFEKRERTTLSRKTTYGEKLDDERISRKEKVSEVIGEMIGERRGPCFLFPRLRFMGASTHSWSFSEPPSENGREHIFTISPAPDFSRELQSEIKSLVRRFF